MEKRSREERACQFMPFAALRGFEELLREKTKEITPRREHSDEEAAALSAKLLRAERGMLVTVIYYEKDGYVEKSGMLSDVDLTMRRLTVVKQSISFDDLWDIRVEDLKVKGRDA